MIYIYVAIGAIILLLIIIGIVRNIVEVMINAIDYAIKDIE